MARFVRTRRIMTMHGQSPFVGVWSPASRPFRPEVRVSRGRFRLAVLMFFAADVGTQDIDNIRQR
jgi:hypothetical protein